MSKLDFGQVLPDVHDDALDALRVTGTGAGGAIPVTGGGSLITETYDYYSVSYVVSGNGAGQPETLTYKSGGAGGATVATVQIAYDSSDRVSSVTKT